MDFTKEAASLASQVLVKRALNSAVLPIAGAALGGLGGYFGTKDEDKKKKLRNALMASIAGGAVGGLGNLLGTSASGIQKDYGAQSDEMQRNVDAIYNAKQAPGAGPSAGEKMIQSLVKGTKAMPGTFVQRLGENPYQVLTEGALLPIEAINKGLTKWTGGKLSPAGAATEYLAAGAKDAKRFRGITGMLPLLKGQRNAYINKLRQSWLAEGGAPNIEAQSIDKAMENLGIKAGPDKAMTWKKFIESARKDNLVPDMSKPNINHVLAAAQKSWSAKGNKTDFLTALKDKDPKALKMFMQWKQIPKVTMDPSNEDIMRGLKAINPNETVLENPENVSKPMKLYRALVDKLDAKRVSVGKRVGSKMSPGVAKNMLIKALDKKPAVNPQILREAMIIRNAQRARNLARSGGGWAGMAALPTDMIASYLGTQAGTPKE
jgi:hypothetical protein